MSNAINSSEEDIANSPDRVTITTVSLTTPAQTTQDPCSMPAQRGPCRARKPRFYFDANTGQCAGFFFGGCRGNANNFQTLQQCQDKCSTPAPKGTTKEGKQHNNCYVAQSKLLEFQHCPRMNGGNTPGHKNVTVSQGLTCRI